MQNDMVEYFGDSSTAGACQFGSPMAHRCVKLPICSATSAAPATDDLNGSSAAQSLTCKLRKEMPTRPGHHPELVIRAR